MGFLEILTLIFVVLKLTAVIDWSWWWVFSPLVPSILLWTVLAVSFFKAFTWMDRL